MIDNIDLLGARGSVIGWKEGVRRGLPDEDNLNLAAYAADIIPRLCDEIEELQRQAVTGTRQRNSTVWVVVTHTGWGENTRVAGVFLSKDYAEAKLLRAGFRYSESNDAGTAWNRAGQEFAELLNVVLEGR